MGMRPVQMILSLFLILGCSPERANLPRMDLSGKYRASISSGSEVNFQMNILDHGGKLSVEVRREGGLDPREELLLKSMRIDQKLIEGKFYPMIYFSSVSFEEGEFNICSEKMTINEMQGGGRNVYYCLGGRIDPSRFVMSGVVVLHVGQKKWEGEVANYEHDSVELSYRVDGSIVFYNQYKGKWKNEIVKKYQFDSDFAGLEEFEIDIIDSKIAVKFKNTRPRFATQEYRLVQDSWPLQDIIKSVYPMIEIVFRGSSGDELIFSLRIYGRGEILAQIIHVPGGEDEGQVVATAHGKKSGGS